MDLQILASNQRFADNRDLQSTLCARSSARIERWSPEPEVTGSNPVGRTIFRYRFFVTGNGSKFSVVARPEVQGESGNRSFYSGDAGVLTYTIEDCPPTAADPPL